MRIAIYGYGVEGQSTEKFLKKHFDGLDLAIFDENPEKIPDENPNKIDKLSPRDFDLIFLSPGIDRQKKIDRRFHHKCTSQIAYFFALLPEKKRKKVIGITGSKGKSTTTKFCREFLEHAGYRVSVAGNFGLPFLDILDDFLSDKYDFVVAEISSFQAEFLRQSPHITVFLSFFPEHLDRHKTKEAYLSAKANCWRYQKDGDFLIFPENLALWTNLSDLCPQKNRLILSSQLSVDLFPEDSVFRASHFRSNFGTILSLGKILNIKNSETILKRLSKTFRGLPHRMEYVGNYREMEFYNDSIATSPKATLGAVDFFGDRLGYLLLGGISGGDTFDVLIRRLKELKNAKVFITRSPLLGGFEHSAQKIGFSRYRVVEDFSEAMNLIFLHPKKGKICLLSPAGKSFDQYPNYKERGEHFKKMIKS